MTDSLYDRSLARTSRALAALARRFGRSLYLYLALVFTALILVDAGELHLLGTMKRSMFDLLVSHRFVQAGADPDIVIVDIDEKSLAALAGELGAWPWPRQAFAEWLDGIEAQGPRAVVFDILFSDPDVRNPEGDAQFDAAIARTGNTWFPLLRLGQQNDARSRILPSMLPGVRAPAGAAPPESPLAVVLPGLPAAIAAGRLGAENAEPDRDSVIRRQPAWLEHGGWRIPHLALRVAEILGGRAPAARTFLLNWRGGPFTYKYVSFSDIYLDLQRKAPQRAAGEFAGKTILLGATAPGLHDIKATPTARIFPGIEILATAIDNLKNGDPLREQPPWVMTAAALLFIWGMALALWRHIDITRFDAGFGLLQAGFVGVSCLALNYAGTWVDLSTPVALGAGYFAIARTWFNVSRNVRHGRQLELLTAAAGGYALRVAVIDAPGAAPAHKRALDAAIHEAVTASALHPGYIPQPFEDGGLGGELFADMRIVYWVTAEADAAATAAAASEVERLAVTVAPLVPAGGGFHLHAGRFDKAAGNGWKAGGRAIMMDALQRASGGPAPAA